MKKLRIMQIGLSVGVMLCFTMANAELVNVNGVKSSQGTAAAIIAAPSHALENDVTNTGIQGFNEAQNVTTTKPFAMDNGVFLPAGSVVDSHMIFLNPIGNRVTIRHENVTYTFSGEILGVMSDVNGDYEAASTQELGSVTTSYGAPFENRGMESEYDDYSVSFNVLTVKMQVVEPGDWIRVISRAANPGGKVSAPSVQSLLLLNNNE